MNTKPNHHQTWICLGSILLIALSALNLWLALTLPSGSTGYASIGFCLNHPPVISSISNQVLAVNYLFTLQVNASDADGNALVYSDNTSLFNINNQTGLINFTTSSSMVGNHSIRITVRDYNSSCPGDSYATFNLNISNSPPVLSIPIPNQTWEEDVTLTGMNLSGYFSDPDEDNLTFTENHGNNVSVNISVWGIVTFKPDRDWYGTSWVIFTANDSRSTTNSNNITLNVTHIENYCGDGICNADESCSVCSADCGSCPPGGTTIIGGGGRGRRTEIIEKIIDKLKMGVCEEKVRCGFWAPEICNKGMKQSRSCIVINRSCIVSERIESRDCRCQPQWECTVWGICMENGKQIRDCQDTSKCGLPLILPLEKECVYVPPPEEPSHPGFISWETLKEFGTGINRAGGAVWSGMKNNEMVLSYGAGIILLVILTMFILLRYLHFHRRKKSMLLGTIDAFSGFYGPASKTSGEKREPIYIGTMVEVSKNGQIKIKTLVGSLRKEEFAYELEVNSNPFK